MDHNTIHRTIQQLSKYTYPKTKLLITKQNITITTEKITVTETKNLDNIHILQPKSLQDFQSV